MLQRAEASRAVVPANGDNSEIRRTFLAGASADQVRIAIVVEVSEGHERAAGAIRRRRRHVFADLRERAGAVFNQDALNTGRVAEPAPGWLAILETPRREIEFA